MSKVIADRKHLVVIVFYDDDVDPKECLEDDIHDALDVHLPENASWTIRDSIHEAHVMMTNPDYTWEDLLNEEEEN